MIWFAIRNSKLFFKDKTTVILSFLAEIIVMILYIMFIRDNLLQRFPMIKNDELIMDAWMIAGVLGITPLTAAMGSYGVMINDKVNKIDRDFNTSPISRINMINGYLISASVSSIIMSMVVFMVSQVYMMICYGQIAGKDHISTIVLLIIINSVCSSAMVILPVSLLKSSNALAACCTIIGSLIGFLTGIYLPIGSLDETVRLLIKAFPISHIVILLRQCLTTDFIENSLEYHEAALFREYMGIDFLLNNEVMSSMLSLFIIVIAALICLVFTYAKRRFSR